MPKTKVRRSQKRDAKRPKKADAKRPKKADAKAAATAATSDTRNKFKYTDVPLVFYRFMYACEWNPRNWRTCEAYGKWEHVRFCLEKLEGCIQETPLKQNSFLVGYSADSLQPLSDSTYIKPGSTLLLRRCVLPKYMQAHVPEFHASHTQDEQAPEVAPVMPEHGSEQDKLQALQQHLQSVYNSWAPRSTSKHASQHMQRVSPEGNVEFLPLMWYRCNVCNLRGDHFSANCPQVQGSSLNDRNSARIRLNSFFTGIPKSFLRPATPQEVEAGECWKLATGELVMLKSNTQKLNPDGFLEQCNRQEDNPKPSPQKVQELPHELPHELPNELPNELAEDSLLDKYDLLYASASDEESDFEDTFTFEKDLRRQDVLKQRAKEEYYKQHPECKEKKMQICSHYLRGLCCKGETACEYLHCYNEDLIPICRFYMRDECSSSDCSFRHPPKNAMGETKSKPCHKYTGGLCPLGPRCRYMHIRYRSPDDAPNLDPITQDTMRQAQREVAASYKKCKV